MKLKRIPKESYKTSKWSGGTTTEFYIYPENGSYAERRFDVRISSATVDDEESVFTRLEGVYRSLMILDGEIVLSVNGEKRRLAPYEHTEFTGEDDTRSIGYARDFNLMTRKKGGYTEKVSLPYKYKSNGGLMFLYCADCDVEATSEDESVNASKGDLIVCEGVGSITVEGDGFAIAAYV